jgi:hypothetical protein
MAVKQINPGDLTSQPLYGWKDEVCHYPKGWNCAQKVGYAKLTSTLQSSIPIYVPSHQKPESVYPDTLMVIPQNAVIYRVALRMPRAYDDTNAQEVYGRLQKGATLIGTTGENVKVAPTTGGHTTTAPVITCASSAYTAGVAVSADRFPGQADVTLSNLITAGSDTPFSLLVSNAGNTAAGNGIRTSAGDAFIICEICYFLPAEVCTYEQMGFKSKP